VGNEQRMLSIRRASEDDAQEICTLHRASIRQLCCSAYSTEQIAGWIKPLTPDRYLPAMEQLEFYVAENNGLLGFFILNLESAELNAIYIHPSAAGCGVGKRLFRFAERLAIDNSLTELTLKSTLNAVGFYESCGFSLVCEATHESPSGVDLPCMEMKKALERK